MTASLTTRPRLHTALRIAAAVLGGYAFTWGFIALGMSGLFALGMSFHDAEHLGSMLGMLVYLVAFLWAFAARSLARLGAVLLGGGAFMAAAASLLQSVLA
ncbi:MAG: iron uptake protein [Comamonadaceae bacterium]|jgi:hypothetical protein|nr:iron uptake protein [Comamonadaceae bacterium]